MHPGRNYVNAKLMRPYYYDISNKFRIGTASAVVILYDTIVILSS